MPRHQSEFWTLDLADQLRRAQHHSRRVTQQNLEAVVADLVVWDWHDPSLLATDWFPNLIHGARALGLAEGLGHRSTTGAKGGGL